MSEQTNFSFQIDEGEYKPRVMAKLQQMTNPPKGETRTAMMQVEYAQPMMIFDFRSKHAKRKDHYSSTPLNNNISNQQNLQPLSLAKFQNEKGSSSKNKDESSSQSSSSSIPQIPLHGDKEVDKDTIDEEKGKSIANKIEKKQVSNQVRFHHKEISLWRRRVKKLLKSTSILWFMRVLTFLYLIIIFISLATNQLLSTDQAQASTKIINIVELHFLIFFIAEGFMNGYAIGLQVTTCNYIQKQISLFFTKNFLREKLQILDSFIILLTLMLVILDLSLGNSPTFSRFASVIKGMFRFFRIVLLFRKASKFRKIIVSSQIKTPAERIIDLFSELKEFFDSKEIVESLEWSVNLIASNKLYETNLAHSVDNKNIDFAQWINYGRQDANQQSLQGQKMLSKEITSNINDQKLQPYLNTAPAFVLDKFKECEELFFDPFEIEKQADHHETYFLLLYLFQANNILSTVNFDPSILRAFFLQIEKGYKDNLYHNKLHAFDVLQTANFFLKKCNLVELAAISELEIASIFIAAAAHDYDHPGFNNSYIINTQHDIAITYNDQSVLENHHSSQLFMLLNDPNLDITVCLTKEQYRQFRNIIISVILGTDMSKHFSDIAKLKSRLGAPDYDMKGKDKQMCIDTIIHACDVSNPVKPWGIYQQWAERVVGEFWQQGDKEKEMGLPVTYLCDRLTTNLAKSQVGFIDFVVKPLYEVISNFLPDVKMYIQQIENNKIKWSELIPFYDKSLESMSRQNQFSINLAQQSHPFKSKEQQKENEEEQ